jgi:hypothetical protein
MDDIAKILKNKQTKKPPAYAWQDLALQVIQELHIPNSKRASVFKVCKENTKQKILNSLNDTKELCETKDKWRYFFKIVSGKDTKKA